MAKSIRPVLVACTGTAAVGGVAGVALMVSGSGSGEDPEGEPRALSAKYSFGPPKHDVMRDAGDRSIYLSAENKAPKYDRDTGFNLRPYRCAKALFPGARMPKFDEKPGETEVERDLEIGTLLPAAPADAVRGNAVGCASMSLQWEKGGFLLKSEIAVRNDRIGFVFWRGIRNTEGTGDSLHLDALHHLAFYEKDGDRWSVKLGLEVGTEDENTLAKPKSLIIKFPDGHTQHLKKDDQGSGSDGYVGMWERTSDEKGVAPLTLITNALHESSKDKSDFVLETTHLPGTSKETDTFFYEGDAEGTGD